MTFARRSSVLGTYAALLLLFIACAAPQTLHAYGSDATLTSVQSSAVPASSVDPRVDAAPADASVVGSRWVILGGGLQQPTRGRTVHGAHVHDPGGEVAGSEICAPSADGSLPFWPNFYAKAVASCYLILCVLAGVQLLRTIVHRHKTRSFRFGFLLVCWLWTALRVLFWFFVSLATWPTWLRHLIYSLPNACQVGTFSLLILFYAKLVHRHRWRALRVRFLSFCILSNTAMVFLTVAFSVLMDKLTRAENDDDGSDEASDVYDFVNELYYLSCALFFGVLVFLAAFYIHKLRTARRSTAGTSRQEVAVTCVIFAIFLSRCIWDACAAFDSDSPLFQQELCEMPDTHVKLLPAKTFFLLFIWEVVPTLMVVGYFRNIPSTSDSYCVGRWTCVGAEGSPLRKMLEGWPCRFPKDYFEPAVGEGDGLSPTPGGNATRDNMDGSGGEEDEGMPDLGLGRSAPGGMRGGPASAGMGVPPYHAMRDTDTSGSHSSLLPPGSFVRSTPGRYSQSVSQTTTGLHIGSAGLGLPHVHLAGHVADLYGSPTWVGHQHQPASTTHGSSYSSHATTSAQQAAAAAAGAYTQLASTPGSGAVQQGGVYAAGGATGGYARYEDEDDPQHQAQQQASAATLQQQNVNTRPPLHAQRSRF